MNTCRSERTILNIIANHVLRKQGVLSEKVIQLNTL